MLRHSFWMGWFLSLTNWKLGHLVMVLKHETSGNPNADKENKRTNHGAVVFPLPFFVYLIASSCFNMIKLSIEIVTIKLTDS